MFTDIKGFTARSSLQTRKELSQLLDLHDRLIRPIFEKFKGTVVKTIGDAFLVTFESPTNAVLCGMAIQRRLKEHNAKAAHEPLEVRVAVNSGEIALRENDVFGQPVNIAARIEGIAEANEIYFTEAVYLAMNKNEIPSAEIGYHHLKGIPDQIKVYKVVWEPSGVSAAGARAAGASAGTAPAAARGLQFASATAPAASETAPVAAGAPAERERSRPLLILAAIGAVVLVKPVLIIIGSLGDFTNNLFAGPGGIVSVAFYVYYSYCLYTLAERFSAPRSWMACVPAVNIFYPITVAARPLWWYLTYFVPGLNVIMAGFTWTAIAKRSGAPAWTGLLIFVPILNFFLPRYFLARARAASTGGI